MGRRRFGNWWFLAVAGAAVVVAWLLYLMWRSPHRDSLAAYGAFVFPVGAVVVGWFAWAWRKGKTAHAVGAVGSEALDHAADQLAAAVQAQWKTAAEERGLTGADPVRVTWGRPSLPLAGPATAATGSHRFAPLPGLSETGETGLAAGNTRDLHALYGGLRSGRLIIAGPPGSGKTGAAVLLVLDALRHREQAPAGQRPLVPVPVLFTAQDWDPTREPAMDWLAGKLQDTYPQLATPSGAAAAAALLASGRITVILDGLDEISPELRPAAVQALSQQATFRLITLSRTTEMAAAAAHQGVLQGAAAVELNPVTPADAVGYLERVQLDPPPAGWQELTRRIRTEPASPLGKALGSPLALTLVRDTYQAGGSISELLQFCDTMADTPGGQAAEAITDHLLDRVLPAAYTSHPGQPLPYDLATAQRTLTAIAARMNHSGTRDLNWWEIPAWTPRTPRVIVSVIAGAITGVITGVIADVIANGLGAGLLVGLVVGLVTGLMAGLGAGFGAGLSARPRVIGDLRLTKALDRKNLMAGLGGGLATGLWVGLVAGLGGALVTGLGAGLAIGLIGGLDDVLTADPDSIGALNPVTSWRRNQSYGLVSGLGAGLGAGLVVGLVVGLVDGLVVGLVVGLGVGLGVGLVFWLMGTETYTVSLASVQLAVKWGTPARLMRFLDDAHHRNVLRAVGHSYQFRHARLQDRLAAAASPSGSNAPAAAAGSAGSPLPAGTEQQEITATVSPASEPEP